MNIRSEVAFVTGANRGIGRAIVAALLAAGARKVYAGARDLASLSETVALDPARVTPVQLNIARRDQVAAAAALAGDVRILVNNAGVLAFGSALDIPAETIRRDFDVNVFGTLDVAQAFAPVIERNGGGAMVNMLSIVSLASMPALAGYNASKAALWSITLSLRGSLAARGVSVHGVFPGPVDTDMAAALDTVKTSPEDVARAIVEGVVAGAEDIFPDPMSRQVYDAWRQDHKAVEHQFAAF